MSFSAEQCAKFQRDGFVIERNLASAALCQEMRRVVLDSLNPLLPPVEYETDVQYPGAPSDRLAQGGDTPRRLLHAYTRDPVFRHWATSESISSRIKQLLDADSIEMSQNHHNCIMTKHSGFGSSTSWHQDIRYWLFDKPELVTVWLALGDEYPENGGMSLLPGTHRMQIQRGRFDAASFLRQDLPENQALIAQAKEARLSQGDVLFFHCGTLHAAGENLSEAEEPAQGMVKTSVVFTYHDVKNQPLEGTRSANYPDIKC